MKGKALLLALLSVVMTLSAQNIKKTQDIQTSQIYASSAHRIITSPDHQIFKSSEISSQWKLKSGKEAFYVVNNSTPTRSNASEGFMIIAGEGENESILGYSDTGSFDPDNMPENMREWLQGYVAEAEYLENGGIRAAHKHATRASGYVAPFVSVNWGQRAPFNGKCPVINGVSTVTGCVATGMATAMSVFKYPDAGTGTFDYTTSTEQISLSGNFADYPINWSLLRNEYRSGSYTSEEAEAIANLLYACGVSADMDYNTGSSGTSSRNGMNALINVFGYDNDMVLMARENCSDANWHELLTSELEAGHPIYYSGAREGNYGHGFIIDGYEVRNEEPYYHVNWGWNGSDNGYFRLNYLGQGDRVYHYRQQAIIGIMPEDNITDYKILLSATNIGLTPDVIVPSETSQISIKVEKVENHHSGKFEGSIRYYLVGNGSKYFIGESYNFSLPQFYYTSFQDRAYDLPSGITNGEYRLETYAVPKDSNNEIRVYTGNEDDIIIVTDDAQQSAEEHYPEYTPDMQVTEFKITTFELDTSDRTISATFVDLANFANDDFYGKVSLAFKDQDGNITRFGEPFEAPTISHFSRITTPISIKGSMPEISQDGIYKLILVANKTKTKGWSEVRKYSLSGNYIQQQNLECYESFWAENGKVIRGVPEIASLTLNIEGDIEGYVGDTFTLTYTTSPVYASQEAVQWASSDESVARVDASGQVSLVAPGTATITVMSAKNNDIQASVNVKVNAIMVTGIELNHTSYTLDLGESVELTATISPDNATYRDVTWTSSDESIAQVDQQGKVTLLQKGKATITATSTDGSGVSVSCEITSYYTVTYYVDQEVYHTDKLTAGSSIVLIDNPSREGYTFSGWSGYPSDLIMPESDIEITGTMTKNIILVERIELNHTLYPLDKGQSVQLEATVYPEDATNKEIQWTSSDESIVTVSSTGLVEFVNYGNAVVTATALDDSGVSATCSFSCVNSIDSILSDDPDAEFFTLDGKKVSQPKHGAFIVKSKGKVQTIILH